MDYARLAHPEEKATRATPSSATSHKTLVYDFGGEFKRKYGWKDKKPKFKSKVDLNKALFNYTENNEPNDLLDYHLRLYPDEPKRIKMILEDVLEAGTRFKPNDPDYNQQRLNFTKIYEKWEEKYKLWDLDKVIIEEFSMKRIAFTLIKRKDPPSRVENDQRIIMTWPSQVLLVPHNPYTYSVHIHAINVKNFEKEVVKSLLKEDCNVNDSVIGQWPKTLNDLLGCLFVEKDPKRIEKKRIFRERIDEIFTSKSPAWTPEDPYLQYFKLFQEAYRLFKASPNVKKSASGCPLERYFINFNVKYSVPEEIDDSIPWSPHNIMISANILEQSVEDTSTLSPMVKTILLLKYFFKNARLSGNGRTFWDETEIASGEDGRGKHTLANGKIFIGQIKKGKKEWYGTLFDNFLCLTGEAGFYKADEKIGWFLHVQFCVANHQTEEKCKLDTYKPEIQTGHFCVSLREYVNNKPGTPWNVSDLFEEGKSLSPSTQFGLLENRIMKLTGIKDVLKMKVELGKPDERTENTIESDFWSIPGENQRDTIDEESKSDSIEQQRIELGEPSKDQSVDEIGEYFPKGANLEETKLLSQRCQESMDFMLSSDTKCEKSYANEKYQKIPLVRASKNLKKGNKNTCIDGGKIVSSFTQQQAAHDRRHIKSELKNNRLNPQNIEEDSERKGLSGNLPRESISKLRQKIQANLSPLRASLRYRSTIRSESKSDLFVFSSPIPNKITLSEDDFGLRSSMNENFDLSDPFARSSMNENFDPPDPNTFSPIPEMIVPEVPSYVRDLVVEKSSVFDPNAFKDALRSYPKKKVKTESNSGIPQLMSANSSMGPDETAELQEPSLSRIKSEESLPDMFQHLISEASKAQEEAVFYLRPDDYESIFNQ